MKKKIICLFISLIIGLGMISETGISSMVLPSPAENQLYDFDISTYFWTETEVVSTESTAGSVYPSVIVDTLGNIHIAWFDTTDYLGSGGDQDIFYKRWSSSTATWTTTEVISDDSTSNSNDPVLKVDGENNVHIMWHDWTDYGGSGADVDIFHRTLNSISNSWSTTEIISTESTGDSAYVSFDIDQTGNIYVSWTDWTNDDAEGDSDIYFKYWNSDTSSWSLTEDVSSESTAISQKSSLVVDSTGIVHVAWQDDTDYASAGTDSDIFYKKWNPLTTSWSTTEIVSTESTSMSYDPSIDTDSGDNVHIVWEDSTNLGSGSDYDIFYKVWGASTSLWSTSEVVSIESTDNSFNPSLAIDSSNRLHLTWYDVTDYAESGTDTDIFYKLHNPLTGLWSYLEIVSEDSIENSLNPSATVDEFDNVYITWSDISNYEGSGFDSDIFFRKFVGYPDDLTHIAAYPTYSTDGIIELDWNDVPRATNYYVYRNTTRILPTDDFVPIVDVTESNYTDAINASGIYYYAVVAANSFGNSSLSEVVSVNVELTTDNFLPFISNEGLLIIGVLLGTQIIFFVLSILIKRKK